jgi:4-amino-4-deoxy-L-arabinose transferase-like glycosyltransferase
MTGFVRRNWFLLALIAGGALLRLATLGSQSFWLDEEATLNAIAGSGIADVIDGVEAGESNPPLYYLLAELWQSTFGTSEAAIRSLSALAGIATIPLVYGAASALATRRAGLVAAALATASPILVWYSQESRNYALLVLLSAAAFLCFAEALRDGRRRWLWGWAAACALALSTHYFAIAFVLPQAGWLFARRPGSRTETALAGGTIALVGAALLPLLSTQRGRGGWIDEFPFGERLLQVPEHWLVGYQVPWEGVAIVALLGAAAVAGYGAVMSADRVRIVIPWSIVAAGVLIVLAPALTGDDYVVTRNLLALWVPFAIGLAVVFADPATGRVGLATAGALCVIGVGLVAWTAATPAAQRPDYEGLAKELGEPARDRLVVSQTGFSSPLAIYLDGARPAADDELATEELVVVTPKPTEDYGVGPCWWLSTCGGVDLLPVPAFAPPAGFDAAGGGETELFRYDIYTAEEPTEIPRPVEFLTPRVFAQPAAEGQAPSR